MDKKCLRIQLKKNYFPNVYFDAYMDVFLDTFIVAYIDTFSYAIMDIYFNINNDDDWTLKKHCQ